MASKVKTVAAPTHYRILHHAVGPWTRGEIIPAAAFADVDRDRLLALKAITAASDPAPEPIAAVPASQESENEGTKESA